MMQQCEGVFGTSVEEVKNGTNMSTPWNMTDRGDDDSYIFQPN